MPDPHAHTGRLRVAAHRYAAIGWPVLPLHTPLPGRGCSCPTVGCEDAGKHPRIARGLHAATLDPALIHRWWTKWPAANIGITTGTPSGLVVLDIDGSAGAATLDRLQADHGPLPATRCQHTARGRHLLLGHPGGHVPNSAGQLGPGLDIRGDGGLIVVAPSLHSTGIRYAWDPLTAHLVPAPAPGWLVDLLQPPPPPAPPTTQARGGGGQRAPGDGYAHAALDAEAARVRAAPAPSATSPAAATPRSTAPRSRWAPSSALGR